MITRENQATHTVVDDPTTGGRICQECSDAARAYVDWPCPPWAAIMAAAEPAADPVNHPAHYTSHPSGIECIQVTEHMGFNLGNAVKYIWRADEKGAALEDLHKARWYVEREIARRSA